MNERVVGALMLLGLTAAYLPAGTGSGARAISRICAEAGSGSVGRSVPSAGAGPSEVVNSLRMVGSIRQGFDGVTAEPAKPQPVELRLMFPDSYVMLVT